MAMSFRDYLCGTNKKIPLLYAYTVFAAFQAPWTSPDTPQEMYFCHVLLIQLFPIRIIVLHAEVFADLLSASSSISELPLVWLFLFSPEQSSMSQLLSSMKLAPLHHFSSWRSGQWSHHQLLTDVTIFSMLFSAYYITPCIVCFFL